jgi:DNA-binding MarR family transcriptional regulator
MRKINSRDFRVATRSTSREINRRIALTVIHEHQPISRAELARRMKVTRGVAGVLVQELIDQDLIYEGRYRAKQRLAASRPCCTSRRTIVWP